MITAARYREIASQFGKLRVAVVGDFCLDRYLEIDPEREETSIETGLSVHNVTNVRSQPGGAGTILNNLCALGVGEIFPIGFSGEDGEGFELRRALSQLPGVRMDSFLQTPLRRTFTYCKPVTISVNEPPREHNRLDSKNWSPTPDEVTDLLIARLDDALDDLDAIILLDQVDVRDTGVVTARLLQRLAAIANERPDLLILADSRSGLQDYPAVCFKMNGEELAGMTSAADYSDLKNVKEAAVSLASRNGKSVFVTLSERGIIGATPRGEVEHVPARIPDGPIDIVGAGDCVMANLTASLAGRATMGESLTIAMAAAYLVVQQLGTTGVATPDEIAGLLMNQC